MTPREKDTRGSRDTHGTVPVGRRLRVWFLRRFSGLRLRRSRFKGKEYLSSQDKSSQVQKWGPPLQWLHRQSLGVCHGATTIPEPQRGVGGPQHLGGERAAAAPVPRAFTRTGFTVTDSHCLRGTFTIRFRYCTGTSSPHHESARGHLHAQAFRRLEWPVLFGWLS